eukprot:snap_masked-scaffold_72-processed-gene-0.38-mRNA-1 protein AED:1.00 eAED:1.00 QI:0/0/0/0/1/1/3/0/92
MYEANIAIIRSASLNHSILKSKSCLYSSVFVSHMVMTLDSNAKMSLGKSTLKPQIQIANIFTLATAVYILKRKTKAIILLCVRFSDLLFHRH